MSEAPWFKFYPSDWLGDTRRLSPAEVGIYITLIATIYEEGGPLVRDDKRLGRLCGCSAAVFRRAIETLIESGHMIECDGFLKNSRAEKEIIERKKKIEKAKRAAHIKNQPAREKTQQKQGTPPADAVQTQCPEPAILRDSEYSDAANAREPVPDPDLDFACRCYDAASLDPMARTGQLPTVKRWLREYPPDLILSTIQAVAERRSAGGHDPPRSLKYFDRAIADANREQNQPNPEPQNVKRPHSKPSSAAGFAALVTEFEEMGDGGG